MALYKRAGSRFYWMRFTFDGELIQQSTKCKNRRDAETVESAYRTQLALGKVGIKPRPKAPTFKKAAEDFLAWSEQVKKPNSHRRLKYSCETLKGFFGETKADRIEKADVEKFIIWRAAQTSRKTGELIARGTINQELITLKMLFKRLVEMKILWESPTKGVKQLTEDERKFHVLSEDEEKRYLMACPQPLQDVATLMLETGMRPTEIYYLKRNNVNLEKGFLQIVNGKTKSSNRRVWLTDKGSEVLKGRFVRFKGEYLFPKGERDFEGPTYQLNEQHKGVLDRTKLKFRLYDCRHTFATRFLETGADDLITLAAVLGHSSLNHVMRYAHPSETRKAEAVQQMQKGKAKAV